MPTDGSVTRSMMLPAQKSELIKHNWNDEPDTLDQLPISVDFSPCEFILVHQSVKTILASSNAV